MLLTTIWANKINEVESKITEKVPNQMAKSKAQSHQLSYSWLGTSIYVGNDGINLVL